MKEIVIVDPNNPKNQAYAGALALQLHDLLGPGDATAVCLVALQNLFLALLHSTTTNPEENIKHCERMLDHLKISVMEHADCAREMAADREHKEIVH